MENLIQKLYNEETPVIINGLKTGRITDVDLSDKVITLVIMRVEEKTKKDKSVEKDYFSEKIYIPFDKIDSISEGEKELPKTKTETKIEDDLKEL